VTDQPSSKETLRMLYGDYSNDVYRYAFATLGDSNLAHDIVQEVFLRAYRSLNSYRRDASAKTWLMTIARNLIFDVLRKRRTERKYLSRHEIPEQLGDESVPMEDLVEVEEALAKLKPEYRHVVVLRYIDGLSIRDTASVLGWSEKKVRNTAHRAMTKLREILDGNSEGVNMKNEIGT